MSTRQRGALGSAARQWPIGLSGNCYNRGRRGPGQHSDDTCSRVVEESLAPLHNQAVPRLAAPGDGYWYGCAVTVGAARRKKIKSKKKQIITHGGPDPTPLTAPGYGLAGTALRQAQKWKRDSRSVIRRSVAEGGGGWWGSYAERLCWSAIEC
ncbi:uncharacterized protein PpBr36_06266 [Pyricularia pennisetigena]|uniref:uncharacterized protein n=1 Tax=Pyricularia pennisetigena TaxID=1578925 RepID=UPI00114EB8C1|nr:uncharacterized protein PpBr36_06266 [Pyricularia pennisetigena]TLS23476.1 hypothetical protein PpBr36_06266 [Pyricularia pennisetigena]